MNKQQWSVVSDQWSEESVGSLARPLNGNSLTANCRRSAFRLPPSAFTLVELLVVIAIISAVTIATVPLMLPALDSRRIRESARMVSTEFSQAQSEAIAKGRSCGVWINRLPSEPTAAMDLFVCETSQPYSGDSENSALAWVLVDPSSKIAAFGLDASDATAQTTGFFHPGDLIRFNYRGPYYRIPGTVSGSQPTNQTTTVNNDTYLNNVGPGVQIAPLSANDYDSTGKPIYRGLAPAAYVGPGWLKVQYQIFRQPVKSSTGPISLPAGAVIDLNYSGMGVGNNFGSITSFNTDKNPILVVFDRTGALESLYIDGTRLDISGPLFFLIGKREKLATLSGGDQTQENPADLENIWISINPQTGLVTTAENAVATGATLTQQLTSARAFAQSAQSMGGR